jgi:hypothetical protein
MQHVIERLTQLAATATQRAENAETTAQRLYLGAAADAWNTLAQHLAGAATANRDRIETALRRADEDMTDGYPEYTHQADDLLDMIYDG